MSVLGDGAGQQGEQPAPVGALAPRFAEVFSVRLLLSPVTRKLASSAPPLWHRLSAFFAPNIRNPSIAPSAVQLRILVPAAAISKLTSAPWTAMFSILCAVPFSSTPTDPPPVMVIEPFESFAPAPRS